jgi:hypothetical protein
MGSVKRCEWIVESSRCCNIGDMCYDKLNVCELHLSEIKYGKCKHEDCDNVAAWCYVRKGIKDSYGYCDEIHRKRDMVFILSLVYKCSVCDTIPVVYTHTECDVVINQGQGRHICIYCDAVSDNTKFQNKAYERSVRDVLIICEDVCTNSCVVKPTLEHSVPSMYTSCISLSNSIFSIYIDIDINGVNYGKEVEEERMTSISMLSDKKCVYIRYNPMSICDGRVGNDVEGDITTQLGSRYKRKRLNVLRDILNGYMNNTDMYATSDMYWLYNPSGYYSFVGVNEDISSFMRIDSDGVCGSTNPHHVSDGGRYESQGCVDKTSNKTCVRVVIIKVEECSSENNERVCVQFENNDGITKRDIELTKQRLCEYLNVDMDITYGSCGKVSIKMLRSNLLLVNDFCICLSGKKDVINDGGVCLGSNCMKMLMSDIPSHNVYGLNILSCLVVDPLRISLVKRDRFASSLLGIMSCWESPQCIVEEIERIFKGNSLWTRKKDRYGNAITLSNPTWECGNGVMFLHRGLSTLLQRKQKYYISPQGWIGLQNMCIHENELRVLGSQKGMVKKSQNGQIILSSEYFKLMIITLGRIGLNVSCCTLKREIRIIVSQIYVKGVINVPRKNENFFRAQKIEHVLKKYGHMREYRDGGENRSGCNTLAEANLSILIDTYVRLIGDINGVQRSYGNGAKYDSSDIVYTSQYSGHMIKAVESIGGGLKLIGHHNVFPVFQKT